MDITYFVKSQLEYNSVVVGDADGVYPASYRKAEVDLQSFLENWKLYEDDVYYLSLYLANKYEMAYCFDSLGTAGLLAPFVVVTYETFSKCSMPFKG